MKHRILLLVFLTAAAVLQVSGATNPSDRPFVHPLFCEHAVLQRGVKVPVWGWTRPGAEVTVDFAGQKRTAVADADGRWMIRLNPLRPSADPRTMTIKSSSGGQATTIDDILVGDVWLCSGQSNMEMGIGACNATNDIATAHFSKLRLLTVPRLVAGEPVPTMSCKWLLCTPENVQQGLWGGFSAAGFYFGRELHQKLNIPIGLIHSSWGGTVAEAWTSYQGLLPLPDFKERLEALKVEKTQTSIRDYGKLYEDWASANDTGTKEGWLTLQSPGAGWKDVSLPQAFEKLGLPDFDGIVWFRKDFEAPPEWAGRKLLLGLGPIDDIDTTWVNGTKVGQMNRYDQDRRYTLPEDLIKPGHNTVTIRVLDTGGEGGLTGRPEQLFIGPAQGQGEVRLSLAGPWQMRDSAPFAKLPAVPQPPDPNNPNVSTVLFDGMISPLLPYALKGAIWYQGESNADRAYQYRLLLPAMIADWRAHFGIGDFPFYIVQLAAFMPTNATPRDNAWAELREAQALTAATVRNCGLAVAIDIGDAADIHPKDKLNVGHRLALCALAKTYGKKEVYSGPWYKGMKKTGDAIRLSFNHTDGGLIARGWALQGFAIAGEDRKFVWADARIEGNTVVVSSPAVKNPVAARYAWDINPVCNLYNGAGLPAVPFRTDAWPGVTTERK